MRNIYRVITDLKKGKEAATAEQCYACNKFFIKKKKCFERHLNVCSDVDGIIYKFENQNIQSFFDNMKFMEDLLFPIYFDFETTSGKKIYNFDDDSTLYSVSYAFMVAFHPKLNIGKLFLVKSFNHTFEQLNDVGHLSNKML